MDRQTWTKHFVWWANCSLRQDTSMLSLFSVAPHSICLA